MITKIILMMMVVSAWAQKALSDGVIDEKESIELLKQIIDLLGLKFKIPVN